MAFSVKITGISKDTGQITLTMEPRWWDTNQLRKDERFVESNDTGSYLDYDADLSLEEMRAMHEGFREAATTGVWQGAGWQEIIQPMLQELDEALYSRGNDYASFHIRVFEWES